MSAGFALADVRSDADGAIHSFEASRATGG
jgi:hypothetical protein